MLSNLLFVSGRGELLADLTAAGDRESVWWLVMLRFGEFLLAATELSELRLRRGSAIHGRRKVWFGLACRDLFLNSLTGNRPEAALLPPACALVRIRANSSLRSIFKRLLSRFARSPRLIERRNGRKDILKGACAVTRCFFLTGALRLYVKYTFFESSRGLLNHALAGSRKTFPARGSPE